MKNVIILLIITILLLLISIHTNAGVFADVPLNELISTSEIIIEGEVIDKSSKSETMNRKVYLFKNNMRTQKSVIARTPYTTFVILVKNTLFGQYTEETIEVKMEGGCGDDSMCLSVSTNYDYEIGDKIVIFLSYDNVNNHYYSSSAAVTAFKLNELNILTRVGEVSFLNKNKFIVEKQTQKKQISLNSLKKSILEVSSNE